MKHIIISGSIGILLAAQAGCGGDDGPPWPQADAEQATRSIVYMALAASTAAGEQSPGTDTLNAEASCATGGMTEVSGDISVGIDGNILTGTAEMDMTMVACGFEGSTMEGPLTYVEIIRIDSSAESLDVSGSTRGRITFTGALEGTCAIAVNWTVDVNASPYGSVVIEGRACGQDVSLTLDNAYFPSGNDQIWGQDEAERVASNIFDMGDNGKRALDDEHRTTRDPVVEVVDLMAQCFFGGSQTTTGTRTETMIGSSSTIEYELSLVLDACDATLSEMSGTLEYLQVEQLDVNTGKGTITEDTSGEVSVSDPFLPSSPCEIDLHRDLDIATGSFSMTGTACGRSISLDY